jgi:hypothetical protein
MRADTRKPAQYAETVIGFYPRVPDHLDLIALAESHQDLLAALKDVVAIADRKTNEFDRARKAIARAEESNVL